MLRNLSTTEFYCNPRTIQYANNPAIQPAAGGIRHTRYSTR